MPGRHWVWDSFKCKLPKMVAIMIFNGHIIDKGSIGYRNMEDVLLNEPMAFENFDIFGTDTDLDGVYLLVDKVKNTIIHSLSTDEGISNAYLKHKERSLLKEYEHRKDKLCISYPNEECEDQSVFSSSEVRGKFQDLSMRKCIKVDKNNMTSFINLFAWNDLEEINLDSLVINQNKQFLDSKKYKHILCLFEMVYALAIEPSKNISTEPGCAWQTNFKVEE